VGKLLEKLPKLTTNVTLIRFDPGARPKVSSRRQPDLVAGREPRFEGVLGSCLGADALRDAALARPSSFRFLRRSRATRF
jgi:hypothetical protein